MRSYLLGLIKRSWAIRNHIIICKSIPLILNPPPPLIMKPPLCYILVLYLGDVFLGVRGGLVLGGRDHILTVF